jgi:hypothetical protein
LTGAFVWGKVFLFRRSAWLFPLLFPVLVTASVRINEVAFDQPSGSPDWVELYNGGSTPVSLEGWALDDGDTASGNHIVFPGGVVLPPRGFLLVFVDAAGLSQTDFLEGTGVYYSGTDTTVRLAATEDQVALYSGFPLSSTTLVDFVAWVTDGAYGGTTDRTHLSAVTAGLWLPDDVVDVREERRAYSIGRRRDGEDTNRSSDFLVFHRPTPGVSNEPPASPYPSALTVDPMRRSFSPFDPDPDFQWTRFYFNTSAEAVKTLRILDVRGRLVRTPVESDREAGGADLTGVSTGSVLWDGRDEGGTFVPLGLYLVILESVDPASGVTDRSRTKVAVGRPR